MKTLFDIPVTRKGLCGWLAPDGEFIPCEFGEHTDVAVEKRFIKRHNEYIHFDSQGAMYPTSSSIGVDISKVTNEQLQFIKDNKENFDERQIFLLQEFELLK
jgi:hypothetical protein